MASFATCGIYSKGSDLILFLKKAAVAGFALFTRALPSAALPADPGRAGVSQRDDRRRQRRGRRFDDGFTFSATITGLAAPTTAAPLPASVTFLLGAIALRGFVGR
ncbi:MAG: hypothetical protein WD969_06565 [Paracoccaceae bacterium]